MSETPAAAVRTHIVGIPDGLEFVPFSHPEAGGGGGMVTFGEIAVLREASHNGNPFVTAFWRSEAATSPLYDVGLGDEAGYIVRGSASVEIVDTGEVVELATGDAYSFRKDTLTRWTIHESFQKFVVVADSPDVAG